MEPKQVMKRLLCILTAIHCFLRADYSFPQYAIWGADDTVLPLKMITEKMDLLFPSLKLFIIKDSGHLPHMEQIKKFNEIFFNAIIN